MNIEGSHYIRNFCIISHVDHGKTTLSDHLIAMGGLLPRHLAGKLRALDFLDIEQERGITIDPSLASFELNYMGTEYKINLIDTPGHVDFGEKTRHAISLVDNGLIVVDAVEGVMSQTRTVLQYAIAQNLKLVLFINKIDRLITELGFGQDDIRQRIDEIIGEIHYFCKEYGYKSMIPSFGNGLVVIGSALDGWAMDIEYARTNGSINQVYHWYRDEEKIEIPEKASLFYVFGRILATKFSEPSHRTLPAVSDRQQIPSGAILITGNRFVLNRKNEIGSVARIYSGEVYIGDNVYSGISGDRLTVDEIVTFRGRKKIPVQQSFEGDIVGIKFSKYVEAGDVLTSKENAYQIPSYKMLEQVVRISIEPTNLDDVEEAIRLLRLYEKLNPGLEFGESEETGELILSAVGTLQIEIIQDELRRKQISVTSSQPREILALLAVGESTIALPQATIVISSEQEIPDGFVIVHEDDNQNVIAVQGPVSEYYSQGVVEGIMDNAKNAISSNVKIMHWTLTIKFVGEQDNSSYEDGLIFGTKVWKSLRENNAVRIHEPYYRMRLKVPMKFIGNVSSAVNQFGGQIKEIQTEGEGEIVADIGILKAIEMADTLRKITDGYIFWSWEEVVYKIK